MKKNSWILWLRSNSEFVHAVIFAILLVIMYFDGLYTPITMLMRKYICVDAYLAMCEELVYIVKTNLVPLVLLLYLYYYYNV